jgi:carbon-monoxide dehydrogenase medium subunit
VGERNVSAQPCQTQIYNLKSEIPVFPTNTHILYPEFEYHAPTTLYEATELLAQYGDDARAIAGGTDLLIRMKMERRPPAQLVSLARIAALREIAENGEWTIGATASIRRLYDFLCDQRKSMPAPSNALAEACNSFSTVQIMYMATLGGNICNASPAADSVPCLLVQNASVTLKSKTGERIVSLDGFFLAPGETVIRPDELLTRVHLPLPQPGSGSAFIKISRVAADISQVCAAVQIEREGASVREARIALGAVAPIPFLAPQARAVLVGETFSAELAEYAGRVAAQEIKPIDDVRATREYRQNVAAIIVRDALLKAWERSNSL